MRKITLFLFLFLCILGSFTSCTDDLRKTPAADVFSTAVVPNPDSIRSAIGVLLAADRDTLYLDHYARNYYRAQKSLLWVNLFGLNPQADTLISTLFHAEAHGLNPDAFGQKELSAEVDYFFRGVENGEQEGLNWRLARLEYYLTKGYLRYVAGQRYGFVNPTLLLNRLDKNDQDSTGRTFRRLTDLPLEHIDAQFVESALRKIPTDSLSTFLQEVCPQSEFYAALCQRLQSDTLSAASRRKTVVNMERCRWRIKDDPREHDRSVFVNIPEFRLYAFSPQSMISMKIGCGAFATKTPLLTSQIKRIEINPLWVIPKSILKNEVARHLGDSAWFARHHYYIRERQTGDIKDPRDLDKWQLLSGKYSVIQEAGSANSLGRIVFRFDNPFAVYIHHTSTPGFFARQTRAVSHGCIRGEEPMALAEFVLNTQPEEIMERIRYSMQVDISTLGALAKSRGVKPSPTIKRNKLISHVGVNPEVPLYVGYYTLYPASHRIDRKDVLADYPDVYGYDRVIYNALLSKKYVR